MKKFILGLLVGLGTPLLLVYLFITSGGMPVAAKGPPLPGERLVARMAIHAAMKGEVDRSSPIPQNDFNLSAGAKVYKTNCAVCHGLPNGQPTNVAKGLFPQPPQLFKADEGVTDDPVGNIYWKVKNGIRLTGMPGYVDSLSDTEIWQVSELLLNADKLSPAVMEGLK